MKSRGLTVAAVAVVALAAGSSPASAEVRRDGDWSGDDPEISLDLDNVPRGEALKRLAAEAGWSVVVNAPKGDPVSLHVEDQPASKLLELLLADGRYVARRDDKLIAIAPDTGQAPAVAAVPPVAPVPPVPPVAPAPPAPPAGETGADRVVTGGNLRIEVGEVVHDVTVMGGNLEVFGTVTGDLSVMGGNVRIHRGGRVRGDAATIGGALAIDTGASVDGDVGVVGGTLTRGEGAKVGGEIHEGSRKGRHKARGARAAAKASEPAKAKSFLGEAIDAVHGAAIFFVFGAVLLALAPERMEKLKVQIASHPMRSFATGVVSLIAGLLLAVAVSLTVIGFPVAVVCLVAAALGTLAAVCSVLETIGGALLAHRTKNAYVHLAVGGLVVLVAGAIPVIGGLIKLAVLFTALGSLVATRGAGLVPVRGRGAGPYRTADAR